MGLQDFLNRQVNRTQRNMDRLEKEHGNDWNDEQRERFEDARDDLEERRKNFNDFMNNRKK